VKIERKAVPGHPGYYADRKGRIWTNSTGYWRLVKSSANGTGYQYTRVNGVSCLTQRLVCSAFKGESTENTPICIRKARQQQPRRVRMQRYLKWGNPSQVTRKRGVTLDKEDKIGIVTLWLGGMSQVDIAKVYGCSQAAISYIVNGKVAI